MGGKSNFYKLSIISVLVLLAVIFYVFLKFNQIAMVFGYDAYKYRYFYCPGNNLCLTVVTYTPFGLGDNPFKRYVLLGRKEYKIPFSEKYVEYPNDTNLFVDWKGCKKCLIISNEPPSKVMRLSEQVEVQTIYDNVLFETKSSENPELSL